ncbi:transcription factor TFIIIC subunit tfc4 [Irineochytrium annulatum]|nr:transcription factor TFIIIC subunit tfc4 [Irineochytrium annulatum]
MSQRTGEEAASRLLASSEDDEEEDDYERDEDYLPDSADDAEMGEGGDGWGEDEEEAEEEEEGEQDEDDDNDQDDPVGIPMNVRGLMDEAALTMMDEEGSPLSHEKILSGMDNSYEALLGNEFGMDLVDNGAARKKRRKGPGRRVRASKPPNPEVDKLLKQANNAYRDKDYKAAHEHIFSVIQLDFTTAQAWRLMAIVHDELGDSMKALQANFLAAHLDPKFPGQWYTLGQQSLSLNNVTDALYCFTKAISAKPDDLSALFQRSQIYVDLGHYKKAIDGYSKILRLSPFNMDATREMARIRSMLRDVRGAAALYESALEADITQPLPEVEVSEPANEDGEDGMDIDERGPPDDNDEEVVGLIIGGRSVPIQRGLRSRPLRIGLVELITLADLYLELREHETALEKIVDVLGRVYCLDNAGDSIDDFNEFDPRLAEMPAELRCKLGICRLWVDDVERAKANFEILYRGGIDRHVDLYRSIVDAYMERRMFTLAVRVLDMLMKHEPTDNPETWRKMANCLQMQGKLEAAAEMYKAVIDVDPLDGDSTMQLAEVCEALGDFDKSRELMAAVHDIEKKNEATATTNSLKNDLKKAAGVASSGNSIFLRTNSVKKQKKVDDAAVAAAEESIKLQETTTMWIKAKALKGSLDDPLKRADFIRTARGLALKFQNTRAFYPSQRSKFKGVTRKYKDNAKEIDDVRAEVFLGLTMDDWYDLFVTYALALTMDGKEEDANAVLESAYEANVFWHDEQRKRSIRIQMVASAAYCGNWGRAIDLARGHLNAPPLDNDALRFYLAVSSSGNDSLVSFAANVNVKWFKRQKETYLAELQKSDPDPIYKNPIFFLITGHIYFCGRSYENAIDNPYCNFHIGVAYIHRAMQRASGDRHRGILTGCAFLLRYFKGSGEGMEACYNLARAFHNIGLNQHAVDFYNKVGNTLK